MSGMQLSDICCHDELKMSRVGRIDDMRDEMFRFVLEEIPADPKNMFRVFRYKKRWIEDLGREKWSLWDTSCSNDCSDLQLHVVNDRFDSENEAIALSAFRHGVSLWKIDSSTHDRLLDDSDFIRLS